MGGWRRGGGWEEKGGRERERDGGRVRQGDTMNPCHNARWRVTGSQEKWWSLSGEPLPCRALLLGCADRLSAACSVGPLLLRHNVAWPRCQGWSSCQPDLTSPLTPRLGTRAAPTARATSAAPCVPRESARQAWRGPS